MNAEPLPRIVCLTSAPRSGGTWTQLLLAQHPHVVTEREFFLFASYLMPLGDQWRRAQGATRGDEAVGLCAVLGEDRFHELRREFAVGVLELAQQKDPAATTVLVKVQYQAVPTFVQLFPEGHVLQVIRDPRGMVASMRAASASFGTSWATDSIWDAAQIWCAALTSCRAAATLGQRYRAIRYEDLLADPAGELGQLFDWCGLPADDALCQAAADACRIDRLRNGSDGEQPWQTGSEPSGFFRQGVADAWRTELSGDEVALVEWVTREHLGDCGYDAVAPQNREPPALIRHRRRKRWADLLRHVGEAVARRIAGPRP